MLNVFFTVDVEVWCGSWENLDERFPVAFKQYVYGQTSKGEYGLKYKLDVLNEYGLKSVFFVEPLFSTRFGKQPLEEIVGLIKEGGQYIELHLHTEWVDEAREPLLENIACKRQHLRYFSQDEQKILISAGMRLLKEAGVDDIMAFRAGSFAFNADTIRALAANHISFDSSYNATLFGLDSGVMKGVILVSPIEIEGVYEYPMTVFKDGTGSLRHVQLSACSYQEIEGLLWQALESQRDTFVILSHNFELLNRAVNRPDWVVIKRFHKLCSFLERNQDCFKTVGFQGLMPKIVERQPNPLVSPIWKTGLRICEQVFRRIYR